MADHVDNGWQVISTYTRQQAIEDGLLVDVTETAYPAGFRAQTCVTSNLLSTVGIVKIPDILYLAGLSIHTAKDKETSLISFPYEGHRLYVTVSLENEGKPCFTVMLAEDY